MIPLKDIDHPTERVPVVTYGFVALNVLVFFAVAGDLDGAARGFGAVANHFTGLDAEPVVGVGADGRTVVVSGSSQGGFQAIVAAGLDPRVTFFAAGVPAGCDHTGFKAGRINGWPKFIATGENPPANVVEAVRYYDAANFASRAKAPGIFTVGFIDTTCPPSSVYAAYNALPGRKEIFHDISAGHTNTPQATEAMRNAILAHVESMKRGR